MRRISRYSQMTVTMMPKAPIQPYLRGARLRTPCWMKSKSSTSEYAAMMTTKTPMMTPSGMPKMKLGSLQSPNGAVGRTPKIMSTEVHEREDQVADHRDQEDLGRLLRRADLAAREQGERDADDGEGRETRLDDDAAAELELEERRDAADEEALEGRVGEDQRRATAPS